MPIVACRYCKIFKIGTFCLVPSFQSVACYMGSINDLLMIDRINGSNGVCVISRSQNIHFSVNKKMCTWPEKFSEAVFTKLLKAHFTEEWGELISSKKG